MQRTTFAILALAAMASQASAQSNQPANPGQVPIPNTGPQIPQLLVPADPDPAMNHPDRVAWELFVKVTPPAATAGNNNVLFETWASNSDTFAQNPQFPSAAPSPKILKVPALIALAPDGRACSRMSCLAAAKRSAATRTPTISSSRTSFTCGAG